MAPRGPHPAGAGGRVQAEASGLSADQIDRAFDISANFPVGTPFNHRSSHVAVEPAAGRTLVAQVVSGE